MSRVKIQIEDGIAEVLLNRPEKRNGLDVEMFEAIVAAGVRLQTEPGLRAVVLDFSRGFDRGADICAYMVRPGTGIRATRILPLPSRMYKSCRFGPP